MKQCGAISTTSLDETVDVVKLLLNSKPTMGRNLGLMAMTGGQSVSITDAFCKVGFDVPALSEQSYEELGSFFNIVGGSYRNPLDMAGTIQGNTETLKRILTILDADPKIDALVMEQSAMFGARQWRNKPEVLDTMLDTLVEHRNNSQKPFFIVMHPAHEEAFVVEIRQKFAKQKIAVFPNFERAATAAKLALPYCLAI